MLRHGLALLTALAILPAHATLIEYSFSASLTGADSPGFSSLASLRAYEAFGVEAGDSITGGFLFNDEAPRTAYEAFPRESRSTYDMSDLQLWVAIGDYVLRSTGSGLEIRDSAPDSFNSPLPKDRWTLSLAGNGDEVNGYTVASMAIDLLQFGSRPLTSSELLIPNPAEWSQCCFPEVPYPFTIRFADGGGFGARQLSIASVPEPATLSLLAMGVVGVLAARRRIPRSTRTAR
jgi:hypothetical protein